MGKVAKKVASLEKTKKWHKNIKSGKKSGVKNKFYAIIAE
jgi:hypothetical protein